MGTRSLTVVQEGDKEIAVLYRQFDGYLEGHGAERSICTLFPFERLVEA